MTYKKVSENEIEETKTETTTKQNAYSYEYLISQKASIEEQRVEQIAARDKEINQIDELLKQCSILGITAKKITEEGEK